MTDVGERLREIEQRLARIEAVLERESELREQLALCEQSRRELAEQTRYLIDRLGQTLKKDP